MKQYTVTAGSGLFGVCLVVTAVLFVLKAAGVIAASWWLVFAPLLVWVGLVAVGLVLMGLSLLMVLIFGLIIWLIEGRP